MIPRALDLTQIKQRLKAHLSPQRYLHCLSVAEWALILADLYHVNKEQAYLAGLLHDCGRTIHPDDLFALLSSYRGRYFDVDTKANPSLWHNPGSVMIAKRQYGISNPFILRAIALHSTGAVGMRSLDKIIYVADYSEPNRGFPHAAAIRRKAKKNLDQAVYLTVKFKVGFLLDTKKTVHPRSRALAESLGIKRG